MSTNNSNDDDFDVADATSSTYLASNDFDVGHTTPPLEVLDAKLTRLPKCPKPKAVLYLRNAPEGKGWVVNDNELRKLGMIFGTVKKVKKNYVGNYISLKVVSGVRRPDGTKGNAWRIAGAWKRGEQPQATKPMPTPAPAPAPEHEGGPQA